MKFVNYSFPWKFLFGDVEIVLHDMKCSVSYSIAMQLLYPMKCIDN